MLFSINNKAILAVLGGAAMLLAGSAAGREDDGSWSVRAFAHPAVSVAYRQQLWMPSIPRDVWPAAGSGKLVVAAVPQAVETPRATVPVNTGKRLGTFGSVAISAGKLPSAYKWRNATSSDFSALFTERCAAAGLAGCDTALAKRLRAARLSADGQADAKALSTVNAAVNAALRYGSDKSVWGKGDYWATPTEIARKGVGDCEDFAIAKMWMLRSLGFSADQLQLIVLQDTRKGVYHAVLAVHLGGTRYILDNLSNSVARDAAFPGYMPIMSFVGGKSYIHGFENKRSDTAGMPKDLASVSPGEGV
jgi:predicted transglutaminase-like cysteine proteinase